MEMKFLVILFTAVAIGAQCRSVELSDVEFVGGEGGQVAVNRMLPEQLKELMRFYGKSLRNLVNFATKIKEDMNKKKQGILLFKKQFLKGLSSLITQFIPGQIIPEETITEIIPEQRILDQIIPEQTIPEQTFPNQREARNMYIKVDNDSILQIPNNKPTIRNVNDIKDLLDYMKKIDIINQDEDNADEHIRIKRAAGYEEITSFATLDEQMTNMLIDIKHHLMQIQKCLDKLCKKHHLTSTIISEEISDDNTFSINQPNKESIIVE